MKMNLSKEVNRVPTISFADMMLTRGIYQLANPESGDYEKQLRFMPDRGHFVVLNISQNSYTIFSQTASGGWHKKEFTLATDSVTISN